jgi:hypothetical protein
VNRTPGMPSQGTAPATTGTRLYPLATRLPIPRQKDRSPSTSHSFPSSLSFDTRPAAAPAAVTCPARTRVTALSKSMSITHPDGLLPPPSLTRCPPEQQIKDGPAPGP